MSHLTAMLLGAIAGFTIFLGLPVARVRGLSPKVQGFLNALATGILIFLLWDILKNAAAPVEKALDEVHKGEAGEFTALASIFATGLAAGLLSLVYFNRAILSRFRPGQTGLSSHWLAMMIATGLGLHNFSEGLAIGQSAATGAIAFAGVLVIGFALHNVTEGFGIAAPMALDSTRPSWGFLFLAGLVGGGPTFVGTTIGYLATSRLVFVLFLTLAAGALIYVINEMFHLGRRLNTPPALAWGVLLGFLAAFSTDLFLAYFSSSS